MKRQKMRVGFILFIKKWEDYFKCPEKCTFEYFKKSRLDGKPIAYALSQADEELLAHYEFKTSKTVLPCLNPFIGNNHQKLENWLLENFTDLLKERSALEEESVNVLKKEFIDFRMHLFELLYTHSMSESHKILFFKKQLKKEGLDPSIVDEIARYLIPGSTLFLLELYLGILFDSTNMYALKKVQDTITKLKRDKLKEVLGKPELLVTPWKHQNEAVEAWFKSGRRGIIEMATATGKTLVGLKAALDLWKRNENEKLEVLVLTHSIAILNQWRREAIDKLGFIDDPLLDYKIPLCYKGFRISFNTLQTVYKAPQNYYADLLIVDEVHHAAAIQFRKALELPCKWKMGLSATIEGKERPYYLEKNLGRIVYTLSLSDAIERGIIPEFEWNIYVTYLSVEEEYEFKEISKKIRDLFDKISQDEKNIESISNGKIKRLETLSDFVRLIEKARYEGKEIPDEWKILRALIFQRRRILYTSSPKIDRALEIASREATEKKCVIFTMDIESCEKIAEALKPFNALFVHSGISDKERDNRLRSFRESPRGVLVAPKMLDEGIDVPDAEVGINVASSKTKLQLIQRIGRILRKKSGKKPVFHHFVAIPSEKEFILQEDGLNYLEELSWVLDTALRMGVKIRIPDSEIKITELHEKSEEFVGKLLKQGVKISVGSYGVIRMDNILSQFKEPVKNRLMKMLEEETENLTDEKWHELLLKAHREEEKLEGDQLNLPGNWWLLIAGGRNPKIIKEIIGKSLGITYEDNPEE